MENEIMLLFVCVWVYMSGVRYVEIVNVLSI